MDDVGDTGERLRSEDPVEVCDFGDAQNSEEKVVDGGDTEALNGTLIAPVKASVGNCLRELGAGEAEKVRSLRLSAGDMMSRL